MHYLVGMVRFGIEALMSHEGGVSRTGKRNLSSGRSSEGGGGGGCVGDGWGMNG